jgi:hypothetical protein
MSFCCKERIVMDVKGKLAAKAQKPKLTDRGEPIAFYAFFKLNNGKYVRSGSDITKLLSHIDNKLKDSYHANIEAKHMEVEGIRQSLIRQERRRCD